MPHPSAVSVPAGSAALSPPRTRRAIGLALAAALLVGGSAGSAAATGEPAGGHSPDQTDRRSAHRVLDREVLPTGDGWASLGTGTTGGADAEPDRVIEVSTRDELVAAVAGDEPTIVRVMADIDANTRPDGTPIACEEYARDGYTLEAYLDAFDPAHWEGPAEGLLEDARTASREAQREQISANVGSNTTFVGVGDVTLTGFTLSISEVDNVILRNLTVSDAYDCFPGWNGDTWKTEWDNVVVSGSTHVWINHVTLDDGDTHDAEQPEYFGEQFLRHDGLLDVVRQADLVTISWSRFMDHDKSLLWGNGDDAVGDRGRLRVTMHHNEFIDTLQRSPRVRFGQVNVYNNVYRVLDTERYHYSVGVGVESSIYATGNWFELADGAAAGQIIRNWGGTGISAEGNWVNGHPTDILAAHNAAHPDAVLSDEVEGARGPHLQTQSAPRASAVVTLAAGPGAVHRWFD